MSSDKTVDCIYDKWASVTPAFVVQGVRELKPEEGAASHAKGPRGSVGGATSLRRQQVALYGAIADLLEVIECKTTDEEIRALAMRVDRLR